MLLDAPHLRLTSSEADGEEKEREEVEGDEQRGRESWRESEERTLYDRVSKCTNRKEDRGE